MASFNLVPILSCRFYKASSQDDNKNVFPTTIIVRGSAELKMVSEEVHVSIILKEYQNVARIKREFSNRVCASKYCLSCH